MTLPKMIESWLDPSIRSENGISRSLEGLFTTPSPDSEFIEATIELKRFALSFPFESIKFWTSHKKRSCRVN